MSTPAIRALEDAGVGHTVATYGLGADGGYGDVAVAALGLDPDVTGKTLVCTLDDGRLVVAVIPVSGTLQLKALAAAAGVRRAVMADPTDAERATGMVVGGIAPLGHRRRLDVFVDDQLATAVEVHVSGGRRGMEVTLRGDDLVRVTGAAVAALVRA